MVLSFLRYFAIAVLFAMPVNSSAVTVVQCRDRDGNVSYRDHCPPDAAKTGEQAVSNRPAGARRLSREAAQQKNPITLYSASECDYCELARLRLREKAIPFKEIDVSSDPERQKELQKISGALTVPTIVIGKTVLSGYSQSGLDSGLEQAGYIAPAKQRKEKSP